ncbi:MAG: ATP-binding cassette domain-containing protein, partial [Bacteroidetes bacterium]|nr:ATP-binding cassette domain-containing protein [Bacteroidota bacterium]
GKSTLTNLLMRQFDATTGQVLVDGIKIDELEIGNYRSQVGYIPQDNFLFSDTILNNVLWGGQNHEEDLDQVKKVTEIADLYKDIQGFEKGFETVLGERGITLSGGQKQRLSIARAIYGNPHLLVFDDSFSAVDTHTEAAILQGLASLIQNRTTVLVSHRVSTVKNANHIIVLDAGRIIEQGSHESLIVNKGYYYSLYKKQLLEKELNTSE